MGFLAPLLLLAAAAVAVPLVLHLFQRHDPRRLPFPALRYLRRAERDHARSIRFRQILLLLLRIGLVLVLVLAAARLYLRPGSSSHDPTALAIVLDNSMSSGLVVEDARVLDQLRDRALEALARASPQDRVWVVRAGEPWDPVLPLDAREARIRVRDTQPSQARGALGPALERAAGLVAGTELPAAEIHLLSDLQASAFPDSAPPALPEGIPVLTWTPAHPPSPNRWVAEVRVGGGLPPMAGEGTELAARVEEDPGPEPTSPDSIPVRLVLDGDLRATGLTAAGSSILFPAGPFPRRSVSGWVETDPDALRADDRRYFAFRVRPPVRMAGPGVDGPARDESGAFFLEQALTALEDAGRIERVQRTEAGVVLAREGADLEAPGPGTAVVVIPPEDPALLPGLNRGLVRAGIPLELRQVPGAGEAGLRVSGVPVDLADVRVRRAYGMTLGGGSGARTLATLTSGEPWIVSGLATRGNPYLVVASPLDSGSSSLPVSASMMPFLDWILTAWSAREPAGRGLVVGDPVPFAEEATTVAAPDGTLHSVGRSSTAVVSRSAGIYRVLAGDSLLDLVAVNTPLPESRLAPLPSRRLRQLVGPGLVEVERAAAWPRAVFTRRQGPELWRPLLVAAALLLVLESWLAATGHREARKREAPSRGREKRVSA